MLTHDNVNDLIGEARANLDDLADSWDTYVPTNVLEALDDWSKKLHSQVPVSVILPPEIREAAAYLAQHGEVPMALALIIQHSTPKVTNEVAVEFVNKEFLGL